MQADEIRIERGSGNVFADLERPDPDAHLLKAELVTRIDKIIRERGLKQIEAAKLLGLSQPDVSRLLRGSFRELFGGAPPAPVDRTGAGRGNRHSRTPPSAPGKAQRRSLAHSSPSARPETKPKE